MRLYFISSRDCILPSVSEKSPLHLKGVRRSCQILLSELYVSGRTRFEDTAHAQPVLLYSDEAVLFAIIFLNLFVRYPNAIHRANL